MQPRVIHLVCTVFLTLPIVAVTYPPLADYPGHLARMYILEHYSDVPQFQREYTRVLGLIPNLAMDITVPFLAGAVGIMEAGRLFLLLTLVLYSGGCYLLATQLYKRDTYLSVLPTFFIYNSMFLAGYINYAMGVAIYLISLSLWFHWRFAWTPLRVIAFATLAFTCYLCHLSSSILLDASIGAVFAIDAYRRLPIRSSLIVTAIVQLPIIAAYRAFMHSTGRIGSVTFNSVSGKLIELLAVVRSYDITVDIALIAVVFGMLIVCFWKIRELRIDAYAGTIAIVMFGAFLICPAVMYTSSGADARFVLPAFICLALAVRPKHMKTWRVWCMAAIVEVFIFRTGLLLFRWRELDQKVAGVVSEFRALPRGARVYPVFRASDDVQVGKMDRSFQSIVCYAVIAKDAYVPVVFAQRGQQPLIDNDESYRVWSPQNSTFDGYDYVWAYRPSLQLVYGLAKSGADVIGTYAESCLWRLRGKARSAFTIASAP
ncbi:MAG: hypothetical protein U0Q18_24720 [Bryobacteraceae bacterium]